MAALTSSSSALRTRSNPAAPLSVVLGLAAVLVVPLAVAASRYVPSVRLLDAVEGSVPAALLLGVLTIVAGRRARRALALTLGRCGGTGAARTGRALGLLGLYVGCTGAIALGFYAVLRLYS